MSKKKDPEKYLLAVVLTAMVYLISILGTSLLLSFEIDGNNLIFGLVAVIISASIWAFIDIRK